MNRNQNNKKPFFAETKIGVVTQKGDWFHINVEQVEQFAPGLLEKVSFSSLIKQAQAWVQSASSLSLILLYVLLFYINVWLTAAIALAFHFLWYQYKSAFVINKMYKVFIVTNSTAFLFVIALVSLSIYAMQEQYVALGLGLLFFLMMKPGLPRKLWDRFDAKRNGLSLNDRVLKMIIIKHALYTADSSPGEVAEMEDRFAELVSKVKK